MVAVRKVLFDPSEIPDKLLNEMEDAIGPMPKPRQLQEWLLSWVFRREIARYKQENNIVDPPKKKSAVSNTFLTKAQRAQECQKKSFDKFRKAEAAMKSGLS